MPMRIDKPNYVVIHNLRSYTIMEKLVRDLVQERSGSKPSCKETYGNANFLGAIKLEFSVV